MQNAEVIELPISAIEFRDDLYPRSETIATLVQKYAEDLSVLPPIAVNQDNVLIDRIIAGLRAICRRLGTTLGAEVDRKMAINRGRLWNLTGDGHGYHAKTDSEDFKHV